MALTATMRRFQVELADADRNRYTSVDLRVAQHPSESETYLVARVVARLLEDADRIAFSRGLAVDDEPAIWQHDLRGDLLAWIEVGTPSVERLHRAQKASPRVAVYGWRGLPALAQQCQGIHRAANLEIYELSEAFLTRGAAALERNNQWLLSVSDGSVYLTVGEQTFESNVSRIAI